MVGHLGSTMDKDRDRHKDKDRDKDRAKDRDRRDKVRSISTGVEGDGAMCALAGTSLPWAAHAAQTPCDYVT